MSVLPTDNVHQVVDPTSYCLAHHRPHLLALAQAQAQTQADVDRPQLVYLVPREPWTAERRCQAGPVACLMRNCVIATRSSRLQADGCVRVLRWSECHRVSRDCRPDRLLYIIL